MPNSFPTTHDPALRLVIIGGVAGGASAAARARRLSERASITLIERGPDVSFANCGLPYHLGGEIPDRAALSVQTPESLRALLGIDVLTRTEAIGIDRPGRRVEVRDLRDGSTRWIAYDKLVLAPGAAPLRPALPGIDHPAIHTLRNLQDMDRIGAALRHAQSVAIIGAGFIGLEAAEQFHRLGKQVTLVELQQQVLPQMDPLMTKLIEAELRDHGVELVLGDGIRGFADDSGGVACDLNSGRRVRADLVLLSIGVRPENQLARDAGLALGKRGHIATNARLQTSDPDIYACGDAAETSDWITREAIALPLGGPANRQGRVIADHIFLGDRAACYPGSVGTAIVRVFGATAGMTGWTEKRLAAAGRPFRALTVNAAQHASYFPGAVPLALRITWDPESGRVLGAQATGVDGVDKRIDVLATAIQGGLTIDALAHLELAYAPPFGSARDIVNFAGFTACNVRDGLVEVIDSLPAGDDALVLDVRPAALAASHPLPGTRNIPLPELRSRLGELDPERALVTVCALGKSSYFAARILQQNGFHVRSLSGGIRGTIDPRSPAKPVVR